MSQEPPPEPVVEEQRAHLRRILISFVVVIVLLPVATFGGLFSWLILPLLAVAAYALREGVRLRRLVRTFGSPPPR